MFPREKNKQPNRIRAFHPSICKKLFRYIFTRHLTYNNCMGCDSFTFSPRYFLIMFCTVNNKKKKYPECFWDRTRNQYLVAHGG